AFGRTFRLETERTARRRLSFGQTVNLVIHHDISDVHIATDRVHRMSHSDRKTVSVSTSGDDMQTAIGHFQPLGDRKCPPMDAVKTVGMNISGNASGAADTGYDRQIFRF